MLLFSYKNGIIRYKIVCEVLNMPYVKGEDRNQVIMFPDCIDDYVTQGSNVRVIDEFVEQLDVETLGFKFAKSPTVGRPPYSPKDLLRLYIYGYINRIRSSRCLEKETKRNLEVIWLLNKLSPDFKTIADFRKDNKKAIKEVFKQFVQLCIEWNLFSKEMVAIDGSKFRASNSKKNNFSSKKIDRHIKYINEKIDSYMEDLNRNDEAENTNEPNAEEIKQRIQELRKRKDEYEAKRQQLKETGVTEISTIDPYSRLMSSNNNGVDVGYNVQTTVDSKNKMIVDFEVTNNPNDQKELSGMSISAKKILNVDKLDVIADKGYYTVEELKRCVENGITPYVCKQTYSNSTGDKDFYSDKFTYDKVNNTYICPNGNVLILKKIRKKGEKIIGNDYQNYEGCTNCPNKNRCTTSKKGRIIFRHVDQDFLDTIDLQTGLNINKYKERQKIVEHPFGTIKRNWGAYYFLTKGKSSVTTEMSLSFLAYNIKRAFNVLGFTEIMKNLIKVRKEALA